MKSGGMIYVEESVRFPACTSSYSYLGLLYTRRCACRPINIGKQRLNKQPRRIDADTGSNSHSGADAYTDTGTYPYTRAYSYAGTDPHAGARIDRRRI